MKFSLLRDALMLLVVFGAMWFAFARLDLFGNVESPQLLSVAHEKELGDLLLESYLAGHTQLNDSLTNDAIDLIEERLVGSLDSTPYTYHIIVVDVPEVNAFATLGGNIVVFKGLIDFAETPEEVAAVLAHEIGHVEQRHVVNKIFAEVGLSAIIALLSNGDPVLIQKLLELVVSSSFSRSQEADADDFAFKLMEKAKLSSVHLGHFFERMEEKQGQYPEEMELFMSHPHSKFRIDAAYDYADKHPLKEEPFDLDWAAIRNK